jgi:acid phosphatase (class A)
MNSFSRNKVFVSVSLAAILLWTFPLLAKESDPAKFPAWAEPDHATLLSVIPAPPETGSAAEKADLDGVLALQNHPSQETLAHAEHTVGFTVFSFSELLGPGFKTEAYPKTTVFFARLETTANEPKNFLKDMYHRIRPYRAFPDQVKELVSQEDGYSYPSGHSTRAWLFALVLGSLDPEHRNDYLSLAMQVCQDRVIGGMHYPVDVLEARVLAEEIFRTLIANKTFMSDLRKLQQEEWTPQKLQALQTKSE